MPVSYAGWLINIEGAANGYCGRVCTAHLAAAAAAARGCQGAGAAKHPAPPPAAVRWQAREARDPASDPTMQKACARSQRQEVSTKFVLGQWRSEPDVTTDGWPGAYPRLP